MAQRDCGQIKERIAEGLDLTEACRGHLSECPPCQELAADGGRLARRLEEGRAEPPPPELLAATLASLEAECAGERGVLARLRCLPTTTRRLLVLGLAAALCVAVWLLTPRPDLATVPMWRSAASIVALGAVCVLALWNALRPLYQAPVSRAVVLGLIVTGIAIPLGLALMPNGAGGGAMPAPACFTFGSVLGLPVFLLALMVERSPKTVAVAAPLLLIGLGAGMVGNVVLEGHCGDTSQLHLMLGHGSVVLGFLGVAFAAHHVLGRSGLENPHE